MIISKKSSRGTNVQKYHNNFLSSPLSSSHRLCFFAEMKARVPSWFCCRLLHELFLTIILVAGCSIVFTYQLLKYIPSHIESSQLNIHFKSTVDIYRQINVDSLDDVDLSSPPGGRARQRRGRHQPPRELIEKLREVGEFFSTCRAGIMRCLTSRVYSCDAISSLHLFPSSMVLLLGLLMTSSILFYQFELNSS